MAQPISIGAKVVATLLLLAFGTVMTAVGFAGGISQLHAQAGHWAAARTYVPVPAQIESTYLDTHRSKKGGTTYRARAQFSYEYLGRRYASDRVSFSAFSDNIGGFQHRVYSELRARQDRGESVSLWVDPLNPAIAVYDKSIRPEMVALHLLFAILFPSVGIGALYLIVHLLREGRPASPAPLVRTRGNGYGWLLFVTLHVNILAWTIALPQLPAAAPMLLPLAGMAMIYLTWRRWKHPRRTGTPVLEIVDRAPLRCRILFHPATGLKSTSGEPTLPVTIDAVQLRERRIQRKLELETAWQTRVFDRNVPSGTEMLEFEVNAPLLGDKQWRIILHVGNRTVRFELPKAS